MSTPAHPTRIVIVDDHALVREGLRVILQTQADLSVIGEVGDSRSAVALVSRSRPDIVLLDLEIPGGEAGDTTDQLLVASPTSKVIILSMYEDPRLVQAQLAAGVRGYLLKSIHWQELLAAIRAVRDDDEYRVLSLSDGTLRSVRREPTGRGPKLRLQGLSARECEILTLVSQALSNGQIASRLELTEATVKRHLRNIFAKLGAVSRIDAVNKAAELPSTYRSWPARVRPERGE